MLLVFFVNIAYRNAPSMEMTRRYVNLYGDDIAIDLDAYDPLARYKNGAKSSLL